MSRNHAVVSAVVIVFLMVLRRSLIREPCQNEAASGPRLCQRGTSALIAAEAK